MKYKWYLSDINVPSIENSSVSFHNIQGFNVPCFGDFFYFKHSPYDFGDHSTYWSGFYFDTSPIYVLGLSYFKFFEYDNTLFFTNFGKKNNDIIPYNFAQSVSKNSSIFSYGISNLNKYYLYVLFLDGSFSFVTDFSDYDLDVFLVKSAEYFAKVDNIKSISILRVLSSSDVVSGYCNVTYNISLEFGALLYPSCCYPDFAPIVQILGGTPSSDQLINLKSICQLLGVDTSENGLSGCDLMKEYLKRLVLNFGSTPFNEPNDNLKSICHFLGVDTSENGLSGCELSKEYVKRDGQMLGSIYA